MRGAVVTSLAAAVLALGCSDVRSGGPGGDPATGAQRSAPRRAGPRLRAFGTQAALDAFLLQRAATYKEELGRRQEAGDLAYAPASPALALADKVAGADESVTNVQHAGVDEGGIVKLQGDYLVVLRRGRLFTVRVGGGALAPVSSVDAFGPDVDPRGTWYDEMLVSQDNIVVIGYSYARGGTELGLFDLGRDGRIRYRATYHLRSNDYYSSRNYASRLLGRKLVFYAPLYLRGDEAALRNAFPSLRKWHAGATDAEFRPTWSPSRVYRPLVEDGMLAVHAVTTCELGGPELSCSSTSVIGPPGRVFYVSPSAVYVWMTGGRTAAQPSGSLVYRLPLDGAEPQALRATGSPVDQFSFLEESGHLNVLLRADSQGDGMWSAEVAAGDVALLRVPLSEFGQEIGEAERARYRALPRPEGWTFQNRFVGEHLLYGTGNGWGAPSPRRGGRLYATAYAGGDEATIIDLRHSVDRIEALGGDAVVVGTRGSDLFFTPIDLGGLPAAARSYVRAGASQGELRSHGFFYKPEGERSGLIGLPIRGAGRPGHEHLFAGSASVLFVRNDGLRFTEAGELRPDTGTAVADGCRASCVDWYGNARPLFLRGRLFALLGYELVEGQVQDGRIVEQRRASFAPGVAAVSR